MEDRKTIIYGDDKETYFYDEASDEEIENFKEEKNLKVYGMFVNYASTYHPCNKSQLWDDMTGYVDTVNEEIFKLDERESYIVCWFKYDENYDLLSLVDMNISKQDIINNIKSQKYMEGANIFLASELVPLG